MRKLEIFKNFM